MRINRRMAFSFGAALLAVSVPLLAAPASAATNPPWEPDPSALGGLVFYNAAGTLVTGGSDLSHLFDYAEASTTDATAGVKATLYFANPTPAQPTGNWPVGQTSNSTFTPPTGAPPPLNTDPNPVATSGATGANLTSFETGHTVNTATGYANVYQVRLVTTGGANGGTNADDTYWESDVLINPDAGTWVEIYPVQGASAVATATTLAAVPAGSAKQHASVALTATVTAADSTHPAGSVEFFQDGESLGSAAASISTGVASRATTKLLPSAPSGTKLTATFTPADTSTYSPSTSATLHYTIDPVAATPTISGPHRVGGTEKCTANGLTFGVHARFTWRVSGKKVANTKSSYVVPASAYKNKLSCTATVHDGTGPSSSATSKSVTVSLGKPLKDTKKPKLSGAGKTGNTERVAHGTWSPKASSYSYQWYAGSKKIKGATKSSLKLTRSDKGQTITCRVTAHKTGYANSKAKTKGVKVT